MPSAAGPAAALGLKTRSALMSGDMDLATTTAAGAAQNAAAQAQSLAAAAAAPAATARSGAYAWGAMNIASQSLPAVQLGGAAGAAGRAYLPAWPSSCCGSLSICSKVRSLSHLLTFAHFLLTFGSRFAEFLLNLAHICTFFCSFSAHFLLTFSSLSPHFSARSGVTGTATTAATTLEQPPRVSTEVICRCLWLTDLLWQIRLLASTAATATTTTTTREYTSNLPCL